MKVMVHIENLPQEYREKLCARKLTRATIDSLARSVSARYFQRKQALKRAILICTAVTVLLMLLTVFAPAAVQGNISVGAILFSFAAVMVIEAAALTLAYYVAVTRVPRQFDRCLQKGYPDLVMIYGYEMLTDGSLKEKKANGQTAFSLQIQGIFNLPDRDDVVVTGFTHGLIVRGNSVYIIDKADPAKGRQVALVTEIEKGPGKKVLQAADCKTALRIKDGKKLILEQGMYLYRED